jgi:hypothetical protein
MQINKDIFINKQDKIKIDFTGNNNSWIKEFMDKVFTFGPPKPKKKKEDKAK